MIAQRRRPAQHTRASSRPGRPAQQPHAIPTTLDWRQPAAAIVEQIAAAAANGMPRCSYLKGARIELLAAELADDDVQVAAPNGEGDSALTGQPASHAAARAVPGTIARLGAAGDFFVVAGDGRQVRVPRYVARLFVYDTPDLDTMLRALRCKLPQVLSRRPFRAPGDDSHWQRGARTWEKPAGWAPSPAAALGPWFERVFSGWQADGTGRLSRSDETLFTLGMAGKSVHVRREVTDPWAAGPVVFEAQVQRRSGLANDCRIELDQDTRRVVCVVGPSTVRLGRAVAMPTPEVPVTSADWHAYQLVLGATRAVLRVDGRLVQSLELGPDDAPGGPLRVAFGIWDDSEADSEACWRQVALRPAREDEAAPLRTPTMRGRRPTRNVLARLWLRALTREWRVRGNGLMSQYRDVLALVAPATQDVQLVRRVLGVGPSASIAFEARVLRHWGGSAECFMALAHGGRGVVARIGATGVWLGGTGGTGAWATLSTSGWHVYSLGIAPSEVTLAVDGEVVQRLSLDDAARPGTDTLLVAFGLWGASAVVGESWWRNVSLRAGRTELARLRLPVLRRQVRAALRTLHTWLQD